MKFLVLVIAVMFLLLELTEAGDNNTCGMQCTALNKTAGPYTGRTSIIFHCGENTEVAYSVKIKVYAVITVKYNIAFATNGKFLVIFNIKTGVYIVFDHSTNFCIQGKTRITFLTSSNTVDHDKLITQANDILKAYTSITITTKDSFDFQLLINAFYSWQNFKIESIYSSKELVTALRENFGGWFALVETQIKAGNIFIDFGYWGFLAVIIDHEIQISLLITEFLRILVIRYHAIETDMMVYLTNAALPDYAKFKNAVYKLTALTTILGDVDIKTFIEYLDDPQYDAAVYQITVRNIRYAISVYRLKYSYVIRITILINNNYVRYSIAYVNGVLCILNSQRDIALALQGTSALVVNKTSSLALAIDFSNNANVRLTVYNNATFAALVRDGKVFEVHEQINAYIKQNSLSGHQCKLQTLIKAAINSDVKRVSDVVGSDELAAEFITSFKGFLLTVKTDGIDKLVSALTVSTFGIHLKLNWVVKIIVDCLIKIVSKGTGFSTFLDSFIKLVVIAGGGSH